MPRPLDKLAKGFLDRIYDHIAHGDEEHRRWLKTELMRFVVQLEDLLNVVVEESSKTTGE